MPDYRARGTGGDGHGPNVVLVHGREGLHGDAGLRDAHHGLEGQPELDEGEAEDGQLRLAAREVPGDVLGQEGWGQEGGGRRQGGVRIEVVLRTIWDTTRRGCSSRTTTTRGKDPSPPAGV